MTRLKNNFKYQCVLVTGGNGNLAREFKKMYPGWKYLGKEKLDITNKNQVDKIFSKLKPRVVLHLAAYVDVQKAEKEKRKCFKINVGGTKNIAWACLKYNSVLIHASTYYVYNTSKTPCEETKRIEPEYPNYYSKTKYLAEKEISRIMKTRPHYILRLGSLFGGIRDSKITTLLINWNKPEFSAITGYSQPAYVKDIARIVGKCFIKPILEKKGMPSKHIYNIANEGHCTIYDYAREVIKILKKNIKVNKVEKINERVKRNNHAIRLNRLKSLGVKPRKWQAALKEYLLSP